MPIPVICAEGPPSARPVEAVLARLGDCKAKPGGGGWMACCPAHPDDKASLSIDEGQDGRVLLNCFAGCRTASIVEALGLKMSDLAPPGASSGKSKGKVVAAYDYKGRDGALLHQTVRYEPKGFSQRRPDGQGGWVWGLQGVETVLYRLPELLAADPAETVVLAEGEKAVEALRALGLVATCSAAGAGKWRDRYAEDLRGRHVVILPDNDEAGRRHALQVATSLKGVAASVKVLELPGLAPKGDVYDWLISGGSAKALRELALAAPPWSPPARPARRLRSAPFSGRAMRPVRWLVENYIPAGKLTVIAGDGSFGKSAITIDLAACLSGGRPCLGLDYPAPARGRVILIGCEDDDDSTVLPRLAAAGADLSLVESARESEAAGGERLPFELSDEGIGDLEGLIRDRGDVAMVVIDPISAFIPGAVDDHKDAHVRRVLRPLADLAEKTGVAVLVVKHLNKSESGNSGNLIAGSRAYVNAARAAFLLGPDPDDAPGGDLRVLAFCKKNLAPPGTNSRAFRLVPLSEAERAAVAAMPEAAGLGDADREALHRGLFKVQWLGDSCATDSDLARARRGGDSAAEKESRGERAAEWLAAFLADGPKESEAVISAGKAAGHSRNALFAAKKLLNVKASKSGFGGAGGWLWSLPESRPGQRDDAQRQHHAEGDGAEAVILKLNRATGKYERPGNGQPAADDSGADQPNTGPGGPAPKCTAIAPRPGTSGTAGRFGALWGSMDGQPPTAPASDRPGLSTAPASPKRPEEPQSVPSTGAVEDGGLRRDALAGPADGLYEEVL